MYLTNSFFPKHSSQTFATHHFFLHKNFEENIILFVIVCLPRCTEWFFKCRTQIFYTEFSYKYNKHCEFLFYFVNGWRLRSTQFVEIWNPPSKNGLDWIFSSQWAVKELSFNRMSWHNSNKLFANFKIVWIFVSIIIARWT